MTSRNSWQVTADGALRLPGKAVFPGEVVFEDIDELDFDYRLVLEVVDDPAPRVEVGEVTIRRKVGGPQVTSRGVASELGRVRRAAVLRNTVVTGDASGSVPDVERERGALVRSAMVEARRRVGANELRQAASAYREAMRAGRPTTVAVAQALGVSTSVARRRIMAARAADLLPAAGSTRPRLD